jgi:hypothetical protein
MRKKVITTAVLVGAGMLLFTGIHIMGADHDNDEKHLFVWAGDQARTNPDFLAVINFDEHSHDYGRVITTVPLPGPGATGNEPHHVGLSADGRVLAAGGLLSVLKGQKEVFFFDVVDPRKPVSHFRRSAAVGHHRRVLSSARGRFPGHDDGRSERTCAGQSG